MFLQKRFLMFTGLILLIILVVSINLGLSDNIARAQDEKEFTTDFRLEDCQFETKADNPYFPLERNSQLVLEGQEDGEEIRVVISVLNDTEEITLDGIGEIKTRVIEEREWAADELVEISRNFFAQCEQTSAVYYFGESVDIYENGEIVGHEGQWRAGEDGAMPGLVMPGTFLLGSRYFQEIAPDVAMDQAEHVAMGLDVNTPAGNFSRCVEVVETTPLEPGSQSVKRYCPGVGLVFDNGAELVDFGHNIFDLDDDGESNQDDD